MSKTKSFTVIELLVVIVIIGILAGIIIVSTTSSITKANITKSKVFESNIQNSLAANMVSRWKLDEGEGIEAKDSWGSNDGTNYNVTFPNESECVSGGCASFNGTSYINFGDTFRPSRTEERTYTFWANLSSYGSTVFSTGNAYFSLHGFFWFWMENSSNIRFYYDTPAQLNFNCSLELGRWDYFVLSINPGETKYSFDLYKNGVFVQNIESNKLTGNYYNTAFKMGTRTDGSTNFNTNFFKGVIDDVRVYNAALSSYQIKQNYVAGLDSLLSNNVISKEEYNQKLSELALK